MITELIFENFRGFGALELKGLQRVNLIVGQNNVGKTSRLEGILLLADHNNMPQMPRAFRPSSGSENGRYFRWLIQAGTHNGHTVLSKKCDSHEEPSGFLMRANGLTDPAPARFSGPIAKLGESYVGF